LTTASPPAIRAIEIGAELIEALLASAHSRRRCDERVADPAFVRLAAETALGPIDAARVDVFGSLTCFRIHVKAVDANRGRSEEALPLSSLSVRHREREDLGIDAKIGRGPLDKPNRLLIVRAAIEIKNLNPRPPHISAASASPASSRSPLLDLRADGDMFLVVGKERVAEVEELTNPLISDRVIDDAVLAPGRHEATPAQTGEMIRDIRLSEAGALDDLPDPQLAMLA
jgi:hypothetical protein